MAIKVEAEPDTEPPYERCCFCRRPTNFWYGNGEIACCESCARHADKKDLPTKKQWCRREAIANGRLP